MLRLIDIGLSDIGAGAVWKYASHASEDGEIWVERVSNLPARSARGLVFGTTVKLANGVKLKALIGNVFSHNAELTRHLLTLTVVDGVRRFNLARYHDATYEQNGPHKLSEFLGLPQGEVFPVEYDLTGLVDGDPDVIKGRLSDVVENKISRISLARMAALEN